MQHAAYPGAQDTGEHGLCKHRADYSSTVHAHHHELAMPLIVFSCGTSQLHAAWRMVLPSLVLQAGFTRST
jgi:hypothetical protein